MTDVVKEILKREEVNTSDDLARAERQFCTLDAHERTTTYWGDQTAQQVLDGYRGRLAAIQGALSRLYPETEAATAPVRQKSFNTRGEALAFVTGLTEADGEIAWAMSHQGVWHISWTR